MWENVPRRNFGFSNERTKIVRDLVRMYLSRRIGLHRLLATTFNGEYDGNTLGLLCSAPHAQVSHNSAST